MADFRVERAPLTTSQRKIGTENNKMLKAKVVAVRHLLPRQWLSLAEGESDLPEPAPLPSQHGSGWLRAGQPAQDPGKRPSLLLLHIAIPGSAT